MINNDMYSLCIDINNKLFTGKPHFASCQVWSINFNLQRFHMNISSRKSNCSSSSELLSSSKSLRISFVQSSKLPLFCSSLFSFTSFLYRSNTETFFEVESISMQTVTGISRPPALYARGSAILRISYRYFGIAEYWSRQCASKYDPFFTASWFHC